MAPAAGAGNFRCSSRRRRPRQSRDAGACDLADRDLGDGGACPPQTCQPVQGPPCTRPGRLRRGGWPEHAGSRPGRGPGRRPGCAATADGAWPRRLPPGSPPPRPRGACECCSRRPAAPVRRASTGDHRDRIRPEDRGWRGCPLRRPRLGHPAGGTRQRDPGRHHLPATGHNCPRARRRGGRAGRSPRASKARGTPRPPRSAPLAWAASRSPARAELS